MIANTTTTSTTNAPMSYVVIDEQNNSSLAWNRLKHRHDDKVFLGNDDVTSSSSSSSLSSDSSEDDDNDVNSGTEQDHEDFDGCSHDIPALESSSPSCSPSSLVRRRSTTASSSSILKQTWTESELQAVISYKRSSWRALPCPDLPLSTTTTTSSGTKILDDSSSRHTTRTRSVLSTATSASTCRSKTTTSKEVRFSVVEVRTYDQTLGENPSVSYGAPIGLDWYYVEHNALDVDLYEVTAKTRRGHNHHSSSSSRHSRSRKLNHYQRKHRLLHDYGVTRDDFHTAKKKAEKIRWQRSVTKYFSRTPSMRQIAAAIEESIGVFHTILKLKKTQK